MITDFLKLDIPQEKLAITLEVLRKFKECESTGEWLQVSFMAWIKLEQLEEFLDYRANGTPLKDDTLEVLKRLGESVNGDSQAK